MRFLHIQFTDLLGYADLAMFASVSALLAQRMAYKLRLLTPNDVAMFVYNIYIYQALSVTFSPFRTGNNREINEMIG